VGVVPGPQSQDPPQVTGWVRPVGKIASLSLLAADIYRAPGTNIIEEVRPTVRIYFDDGVAVDFSAANRTSDVSQRA
jgi:hypothetical protein